jgi:hypothetical protein
MEDKANQNKLMARFLFGELSEEERHQVEERLFIDDEYFERLQSFEDSLIDDYVRGALPEYSKEEVEKFLSMSELRLREVGFVKRLVSDISSVEDRANDTQPKRWSLWQSFLAMGHRPKFNRLFALPAFIIMTVIATSLLIWNLQVQNRVRQIEMERANLERKFQQRIQEQSDTDKHLLKQLDEQRDKINQLEQEMARMQQSSPTSPFPVVSLTLSALPIARGGGALPQIQFRSRVQRIKVKVEIPGRANYPSYNVTIKNSEGKVVWSRVGIKPDNSDSGALIILLPANDLDSGTHILTLSAQIEGNEPVYVHDYAFLVKR